MSNIKDDTIEVILVDGGSTDRTLELAKDFDFNLLHSDKKGRAKQMNLGVEHASGDVLYFIHGDVIPPNSFIKDISVACSKKYKAGWFSYQFNPSSFWLRINAWFTKQKGPFSGGGDQTLFIDKSTFVSLGGFDETYCIMEDFALTCKIKKRKIKFTVIQNDCIVSSRKFTTNSWLRVNLVNLTAFLMFKLNIKPQRIMAFYKKGLNKY